MTAKPLLDLSCPRCGSTLLTNDEGAVWCTFVGDKRIGLSACRFGVDAHETRQSVERLIDDLSAMRTSSEGQ